MLYQVENGKEDSEVIDEVEVQEATEVEDHLEVDQKDLHLAEEKDAHTLRELRELKVLVLKEEHMQIDQLDHQRQEQKVLLLQE